jgi:cytochrome c peroxidase
VLGSIKSPGEMNQSLDGVTRIRSEIDRYQLAFSVAFQHQTIMAITVAKAIATYERMLVSAIAPFDAWG